MPDLTYTVPLQERQGGAQLVAAATGTITAESGALIDIQSGATLNLDGTVKVGGNTVYLPTASAASKRLVMGGTTVTGTVAINFSGTLSSVDSAVACLGTSQSATDPDAVTVAVSSTTVTFKVWKEDASASAVATPIYYFVSGTGA